MHFSVAASEIHNVRLARSHEPTLLAVRIVPEATTLWGADASQRFVVMGEYSDGLERDVTLESRFRPKGFHPGRGE